MLVCVCVTTAAAEYPYYYYTVGEKQHTKGVVCLNSEY